MTEPERRSAKRKLSTSASIQDAAKKTKVDEGDIEKGRPDPPSPDKKKLVDTKPSDPPKNESHDVRDAEASCHSDDEDEDNYDDDDEENCPPIEASTKYKSGPRVFYIWREALSTLVPKDEDQGQGFLVPKVPFDDCYKKVIACQGTEADKKAIIDECLYNIHKFAVYNEGEDRASDGARKLEEVWKVEKKRSDWWFKVTLDSQEPENGKPATRLTMLEYEEDFQYPDGVEAERGEASRWWITNVAAPDAETLKGIEYLKDRVWDGRDPMD